MQLGFPPPSPPTLKKKTVSLKTCFQGLSSSQPQITLAGGRGGGGKERGLQGEEGVTLELKLPELASCIKAKKKFKYHCCKPVRTRVCAFPQLACTIV